MEHSNSIHVQPSSSKVALEQDKVANESKQLEKENSAAAHIDPSTTGMKVGPAAPLVTIHIEGQREAKEGDDTEMQLQSETAEDKEKCKSTKEEDEQRLLNESNGYACVLFNC